MAEAHDTPAGARFFRTVAEMHAIPKEKVSAFVLDLALWLQQHRLVHELTGRLGADPDVFGWMDDGRHEVQVRLNGVDLTGAQRTPHMCRCGRCGHVWTLCYLPLAADLFTRVAKRATCPMCAETRELYTAEQKEAARG